MENENESNQIPPQKEPEEESARTQTEVEPCQAQDFKLEAQKDEGDEKQEVQKAMEVDEVASSINAQKVQVAE